MNPTKQDLQDRVMHEYFAHVGRYILVSKLTVHVGDEQVDVDLSDKPLLAKVLQGANDMQHLDLWDEDWIDPVWPIKLWSKLPGNMTARVVQAPCYSLTGRRDPGGVLPAPTWIRRFRRIRSYFSLNRSDRDDKGQQTDAAAEERSSQGPSPA